MLAGGDTKWEVEPGVHTIGNKKYNGVAFYDSIQIIQGALDVGSEIRGLMGENFFNEGPDMSGAFFWRDILFYLGAE